MNKPLVIFDLETTGTDKSKDKIIQIAAIKVVDGEIVDSINEYVQPIGQYTISYGAYFKHKITPQFLSDKPTLRDLAPKIIEFFEGCDILTYNGNRFDIPFLKQELLRIGYDIDFLSFKCYDAYLEEQRRNNTKLETTYKRYYGKTMDEDGLTAHDALSDVKATYRIFKAQQEIQPYEPEKMYDENGVLSEMEFNGKMEPCFTIGKYRELAISFVAQIDLGYLAWCVSDKSGFLPSTKEIIKKYM